MGTYGISRGRRNLSIYTKKNRAEGPRKGPRSGGDATGKVDVRYIPWQASGITGRQIAQIGA